jgi:inosine-uridine nucleoside N-ribohydrolase
LDDQHALAYLLLNGEAFETVGVTVNATSSGGEIGEHLKEAERIIRLCGMEDRVPLYRGANGDFPEISRTLESGDPDTVPGVSLEFDGREAVDFIIAEAMKEREDTLVLLPVGKLTNVALALLREPAIAGRVRVVWLGSNYPDPGEYNLENDTAALAYILQSGVPFEMVTVRYGKSSGTAAVTVTREEINAKMPGAGPEVKEAVTGRHGGSFTSFGDYSVNLFSHAEMFGEEHARSLFDMAAVAIVKDPSWAKTTPVPRPLFREGQWIEQPGNPGQIVIWEEFDRGGIIADFFATFE